MKNITQWQHWLPQPEITLRTHGTASSQASGALGKDSSFRDQSKTVEILAQIRFYSSLQRQHPVEKAHSQITRCKFWQITLGSTCETSQEHSKHYELWLHENPVEQSEQNRLWIKINFVNVNLVQPHTWRRMSDKLKRSNLYKGKLTYPPSLLLLLGSTAHGNVRSRPA